LNYDKLINDLVEAIKADKAIIQPWRNKAVARLEESQAFVRMGRSSSSRQGELTYNQVVATENNFNHAGCICPTGAVANECPVHGERE
jgi:hypothetical protein